MNVSFNLNFRRPANWLINILEPLAKNNYNINITIDSHASCLNVFTTKVPAALEQLQKQKPFQAPEILKQCIFDAIEMYHIRKSKIDAIKIIRNNTNLNLLEVKEFVEQYIA